jgi:hypothetical protein
MNEASINWEDDHAALAFTLERRAQSEHGVARVAREHLDHVRRLRNCVDQLAYERREIDDNPHHGNLLYRSACPKHVEKMIASVLAADAELIRRG